MRLIAGLGNPGTEYAFTRHNMGWLSIEHIVHRNNLGWPSNKFNGGFWQWKDVILLKPTTFMNMSGVSVGAVVNFYKIEPEDVLIICDDTALPFGKLRLRAQGSAGGHNGLASIIGALGTLDIPRLRIGIGKPPDSRISYVLGRLNDEEIASLPSIMDNVENAVNAWLEKDIQKAMTIINSVNSDPSEN